MPIDNLKKMIRLTTPKGFRNYLWRLTPKIHKVNTYRLQNPQEILNLKGIDKKFTIIKVGNEYLPYLKKAYDTRGVNSFKNKVPGRLASKQWVGLAVFDNEENEIAYISWIVIENIPYFSEFGIQLKEGQYLLKDGYCVPKYRGMGLHTRMEQERINYCVRKGAIDIFIQIHNSNIKGVKSVLENNYKVHLKSTVIQWPALNVYRNLRGFLINPFKRIIK